jgi:hypothetical protein
MKKQGKPCEAVRAGIKNEGRLENKRYCFSAGLI